jgi:small-conductance mechanosensitive channel
VGIIAAKVLGKMLDRFTRRNLDKHSAALLHKIAIYIIISASVLAALSTLGIKLSGLLATAGLLTVALGFAAQTSVSNIISGFFLLMEKPFEVGDVVEVEGEVGIVLSLDLLSTKLRTFLKASPIVLEDPKPMIITTSLADSGIQFEAKVWIDRTQLTKPANRRQRKLLEPNQYFP